MKASTLLLGASAALMSGVAWLLWDRSLHANLWIDNLSPCLFPAILLLGFAGAYRRGAETGRIAGEVDFKRFMKRHGLAYAGLLGAAMVALWAREGFEAAPYVLFFGLPFFGAGLLLLSAVIGVLSCFWPGIRTGIQWLWLGGGVCFGASALSMVGRGWTAIPFLLLLVPGLARDRRSPLALLRSPAPWCLAAAALTLAYWQHARFWQIPWRVMPLPYDLIPWAALGGALFWAAHRFGGKAVRRAAVLGGSGLATAVVLLVILFAGAAARYYVVEEVAWKTVVRYAIVFEAESAQGVRRAEEIVTVERKVLPVGRRPRGSLREHGSFPSLTRPGGPVILADLRMDRKYLKILPLIAREALETDTGRKVPATDAPLELVGRARPAVEIISALEGGAMRTVPYERNGLGLRFRVWIEVRKGWDALDELFVLNKG